MKQTRHQWAIIALFFAFSPSLSAQNQWTPTQKALFSRIVQLLISIKNTPAPMTSTVAACAISNEITITIAPCKEEKGKEAIVQVKPVQ